MVAKKSRDVLQPWLKKRLPGEQASFLAQNPIKTFDKPSAYV
jgi:hypothetical protein